MEHLIHELESLAENFRTDQGSCPVLDAALECGSDEALDLVARFVAETEEKIKELIKELREKHGLAQSSEETLPEHLDEMSAMASEFSESGDPFLEKQAAILDYAIEQLSKQAESDLDSLRKKYYEESGKRLYEPKKDPQLIESAKSIEKVIKQYRPMEFPLSTRSCPDHHGTGITRLGDGVYQCLLDNRIYDYNTGFKMLNGDVVPGGSVAQQSHVMNDRGTTHSPFDTREERLAQNW